MHAPVRLFAAAALAAAASATAAPAHAACAGTQSTFYVCVTVYPGALPTADPTGSSIDDCVYLGPPPCTPVSVPVPTVTWGEGQAVSITCGGALHQPWIDCY